ncbi:hypothetical protein EWB00_002757 [Schistosoma japonicum]|uniref:Uncharacterized protein n=1 Tax=Schistosoma japonicum TaxID=6182 RepID=A0A4Z2DB32_SCHJA|nr:hypothetical protein EWB00_002757 [Schistosoma japonicum]
MSTIDELMRRFYWKSITKCIWKENFDHFDETIDQIHAESVVFDTIMRSNNVIIPSFEKITKATYFLKQNHFWRCNPFSLLIRTFNNDEDDDNNNEEGFLRVINQLQMKNIKDLWEYNYTKMIQNIDIM